MPARMDTGGESVIEVKLALVPCQGVERKHSITRYNWSSQGRSRIGRQDL